MFDINLIENITNSFLSGDHVQVVDLLRKEASIAKNRKKNIVARRLDNIIKKIPTIKRFGVADLSGSERSPVSFPAKISNKLLVDEYFSEIAPEEVILNSDTSKALATLFREWEDHESLIRHGLNPVNKILLYGAPGTGKTKLAHAIAHKLNFPIVLVRLDELISSYLGKTGQNIREIFEIANRKSVVLFLDEIDTVAKHRADEKELGELKRVVTVLLQNIDLFPSHSVVIGATNHEEILDKAIWRRFPLKIKLELPSGESRRLLLLRFLGNVPHQIDLSFVVKITENLSGSEIYDLVQYGLKNFVISKRPKLVTSDLLGGFLQSKIRDRSAGKTEKHVLYSVSQYLKDQGHSLVEIAAITHIPYTTLRDNVK